MTDSNGAAPRGRAVRIALTGGPGGGKTTAADMIGRELGTAVCVLKETATMLFEGGFPRNGNADARRACQRAIYHAQRENEAAHQAHNPGRILLCDRGTLDSAVYWPDGPEAFFRAVGSDAETERARYDGVVFFESAALGGMDLDRGNRFRVETSDEAARLDGGLRALWEPHPRYRLIPHSRSFLAKVVSAIGEVQALIREIEARA